MNCDDTKLMFTERNFYTMLSILVPIEDCTPSLFIRLEGVLNKYSINKKNIYEVNLKRIEDGSKEKVEITIKFYKFNIAEFKAKSERDKIVTALNLLGFEDKDILYLYKRDWWFIVVKPKEKFDDDESQDRKVKCEFDIEKQLRDLLNFNVFFEFDSES